MQSTATLITICHLRLFVARTQINSLKHAFICFAELRTKCLIHFIVNLRKMPTSILQYLTQWFAILFVGILFPTNAVFHSTLYVCWCRPPNPRNVFIAALKMVKVKIRLFQVFNSLSFAIHWFEVEVKKFSTTLPLACGGGQLCHGPPSDPKNKKMYKQYSAAYTVSIWQCIKKCLILGE